MRTRPGRSLTGKYKYTNGTYSNTQTLTFTQPNELCEDLIGRPISDGLFNLSHSRVGDIPRVDGSAKVMFGLNNTHHEFFGYPIQTTTVLNTAPLPAKSGWMLDLVAGTNPSRPVVTPPTLIQDLIELPKMVYNLGKLLQRPGQVANPRGVSSEYLGIKFGWLPLIEDINHLLNVQSHVMKRNKELSQLYSGKGLRRRLKFDEANLVEKRSTTLGYVGAYSIICDYEVTVKKKSWGTIHWYPAIPIPGWSPDDRKNYELTRRIVLGLTMEGIAKGLWDVIPWTWLLGWFTNVGKFALAYSNTVPAYHGAGCFMSSSDISYQPCALRYIGPWTEQSVRYSKAYSTVKKTRAVSSTVSAGAYLPYLDGSRLSILGALFAQRFL